MGFDPTGQPARQYNYGSADPDLGPPRIVARKDHGWLAAILRFTIPIGLFVVGVVIVAHRHAAGPSYPQQWDSRVLPVAQFVEKARGLTFKHPIYVDFLSDSEFRAHVQSDPNAQTPAQSAALAAQTAELRAMGLLDGTIDLGKAQNDFNGENVVGFYSFDSKRIAVRGQTLSLAAKVTLAHELTHALQDQYYDIANASAQVQANDADASFALRDLAEGDAVRIEDAYLASLSASDQAEVKREQDASGANAPLPKGVPQILEVRDLAPYVLGPQFVKFIASAAGAQGVADTFTDLPTTEMDIVQPWRFLARTSLSGAAPDTTAPGTTFDNGTVGALTWYLMLADKIGPQAAMRAVDGWDGDYFVASRDGSSTCLTMTYESDSSIHLAAMTTALRSWMKDVPENRAKLTSGKVGGASVVLTTCDPGVSARPVVRGQQVAALRVAAARLGIAVELVKKGATASQAGCAATSVVEQLTLAQLEAPSVPASVKSTVAKDEKACR